MLFEEWTAETQKQKKKKKKISPCEDLSKHQALTRDSLEIFKQGIPWYIFYKTFNRIQTFFSSLRKNPSENQDNIVKCACYFFLRHFY